MNDNQGEQVRARISSARDLIKRFAFTAGLGNPTASRIVDEARERLQAAQNELAQLEAGHHKEEIIRGR